MVLLTTRPIPCSTVGSHLSGSGFLASPLIWTKFACNWIVSRESHALAATHVCPWMLISDRSSIYTQDVIHGGQNKFDFVQEWDIFSLISAQYSILMAFVEIKTWWKRERKQWRNWKGVVRNKSLWWHPSQVSACRDMSPVDWLLQLVVLPSEACGMGWFSLTWTIWWQSYPPSDDPLLSQPNVIWLWYMILHLMNILNPPCSPLVNWLCIILELHSAVACVSVTVWCTLRERIHCSPPMSQQFIQITGDINEWMAVFVNHC